MKKMKPSLNNQNNENYKDHIKRMPPKKPPALFKGKIFDDLFVCVVLWELCLQAGEDIPEIPAAGVKRFLHGIARLADGASATASGNAAHHRELMETGNKRIV
jgi:hypothetical protein